MLKEEWSKYKNTDNYNINLGSGVIGEAGHAGSGSVKVVKSKVEQSNNYRIEEGLSTEEFHKRLDQILGHLNDSDYFKLGFDLAEIIAQNSKIF